MDLFDVYNLSDLNPVKAKGCYLWDANGAKYLDLYGGHAVISIGHTHPHYVQSLSNQLCQIGFYSNSVQIAIQEKVAALLGQLSGYDGYQLFFCNSGAEANENAIKLASFHNKKKKVLSFSNAFHGRTSMAVAATDNKTIVAPVNETDNIIFAEFNNPEAVQKAFAAHEISSVIVEGIQGVGGIQIPTDSFLQEIEKQCSLHNAVFILDEVQSGYGRTGKFFAHQYSGVKPDMITIAKGMGNGFPVAGLLIAPDIKPVKGLLGSTFGGNYLACTAALSVMEIIEKEALTINAANMGNYLVAKLAGIPKIKQIRARGLMVGIEFEFDCNTLRKKLLSKHHILTGNASDPNTMRILPSLTISKKEIDFFIQVLKSELSDAAS